MCIAICNLILTFLTDSDYKAKVSVNYKTTKGNECKEKAKDDGDIACYKNRLKNYYEQLEDERNILHIETTINNEDVIKDGLKIPGCIWNNLYRSVRKYKLNKM